MGSARFGVAVSGGADSMALLHLAHELLGERVEAATVDHGLRAESAAEAEMVARWCAGRGIAHAVLRPAEPIVGNLQSAARVARYGLLEQWGSARKIDWIMTAHHADDQAETLLMRLNRGAGVGGLAGVRARNGRIIRPLLAARRGDLRALARDVGLPFVDDPSNDDARFDRVAMRQNVRRADWLDVDAIARSAGALAQAQDALEWVVSGLIAKRLERLTPDRARLSRQGLPADLPPEIARRLLIALVDSVAGPNEGPPRGGMIDAALAALENGGKAMVGNWLIEAKGDWTIGPAPPRGQR